MVSNIDSNVSSLQLYGATRAFNNASKPQEKQQEVEIKDRVDLTTEFKGNAVQSNPISVKEQENINKIKEFVNNKYEDIKVSEEDINYALKYGRSILVNYSA